MHNHIYMLLNQQGVWIDNQEDIKDMILSHFSTILANPCSTSQIGNLHAEE